MDPETGDVRHVCRDLRDSYGSVQPEIGTSVERSIHYYGYVDERFDDVTQILADATGDLLQSATTAASTQTRETFARLRVPLGDFEIGRDVKVVVGDYDPVGARRGRIPIRFEAASRAALFPSVEAYLEVEALAIDPPYSQITLVGTYRPPLGALGAAGDALLGHRVADAAIRELVEEITARLKTEITARRSGLAWTGAR